MKVIRLKNGQKEVLDDIRDLERLVEPEIYEAFTYFLNKAQTEYEEENETDSLEDDLRDSEDENNNLQNNIEELESEVKTLESSLKEIQEISGGLIDDINNSEDLNEVEMLQGLHHIGGIIINAL